MLFRSDNASMPLKFWDEAFFTATHLINMLPSKVIDFHTPFERLFNKTPDYTALRVFGCACWPNLRPYNARKLSFRSKQCLFIGYSAMHKGVKCLDVQTGRVYISRDVVFDETIFPFQHLHPNAGAQLRKEILLLPEQLRPFDHGEDNNRFDHLVNSHTTNPVPSGEFAAENAGENGANFGQNRNIQPPLIDVHAPEENNVHGGDPEEDLAGPSTPVQVWRAPIASSPMAESRGSSRARAGNPGSSPSGPTEPGPIESPSRSEASGASGSSVTNNAVVPPVQQRPVTRLQQGIVQPRKLFKGMIR